MATETQKRIFSALLSVCFLLGACACGGGRVETSGNSGESGGSESAYEEDRVMTDHAVYDGVALPDELWTAPEWFGEAERDRTESVIKGEIKAIRYRSDYDGQESYAFAYLGIPEGASAGNKKPAVLLVHGGGGTAYWQWVSEWVNRGYVALAMDLEGHVPLQNGTSDNMPADLYENSEYPAPHNQNYGDAESPIEQTWMYYAVSTAIRGNSLLHGLEYVNKNKIGVCGVSWGGVITSIISGYDDRFAFSIPIYCSLNLAECGGGNLTSYYKSHPAARVWDDDEGLSRVNTPLLFLAMNDDISAFPDSISITAERCKNASVSIVRYWAHSHSHAFARPEPYAFADGIVNGGAGLIKVETQPGGVSGSVKISLPEGVGAKAYIACTGSAMKAIPDWQHTRLTIENGQTVYKITDEMQSDAGGAVTYYYLWFEDSLGRVVSTNLVSLI